MKEDMFSSQEEEITLGQFLKNELMWPASNAVLQKQLETVVSKLEGTHRPEDDLTCITQQDMVRMAWDDLEVCLKSRGLDQIAMMRIKDWKETTKQAKVTKKG